MAWKKNENREEMHKMYLQGYSLSEVAKHYGKSRQSVFDLFKNHNMETRKKKTLPVVEFNGFKYTLRNTGYFGKTLGCRTLLHRDMWEFHNGAIPDGWDVHHKDGDKTNNVISNFECMPKADHSRYHQNKKGEKCGS